MSAPAPVSLEDYARPGQYPYAAWSHALTGIALGVPILLAAYRSTLFELLAIWRNNAGYSYAWAVLPSLAYLLWHQRARLAVLTPAPSALGVAATVACGVAWLGADLANLAIGRHAAFVAALACLVLSAVGWRVFGRLAPFLALLVLLVPSGDVLVPPLKALTVRFIVAAASLVRIPYSFDGNVIYAGINRYVVIDDCAGLPVVLSCLFLALTFGLLMYRTAWKIALFALAGAACGIVANGLRVASIVVVDWLQGTQMELSSHAYFQWAAFALAVAALFAMLTRGTADMGDLADGAPQARGERSGARSLMAAFYATILTASIPQIAPAYVEQDASVSPYRAASILPERIAAWTRQTGAAWHPAPRIPIPYDEAPYVLGERRIEVFVAVSDRPTHKISGYSIDLAGPGEWRERGRVSLADCPDSACRDVHVLELVRRASADVRRVYYVYAIDGDIVSSALMLRLRLAWDRLRGGQRIAKVIAIASDGRTDLRAEEVTAILHALASQHPPRQG